MLRLLPRVTVLWWTSKIDGAFHIELRTRRKVRELSLEYNTFDNRQDMP